MKELLITGFILATLCAQYVAIGGEAPVSLRSASTYGVLAGSTVTSTGNTVVDGNLGLSPGTSVTGFPPGVLTNGTMHITDSSAAQAQLDLILAYNEVVGRTSNVVAVSADIGGQILTSGLYQAAATLAITTGDLTLNAAGDTNAVFIFKIGSTLTVSSGRQVILIGGANSANIFWQVGSSATLETTSACKGTIMADQSITFQTGATLEGRALAKNAAVTLDNNVITTPMPMRPRFTAISRASDGIVTLTLAITPYYSLTLQHCSDLVVSNWVFLSTEIPVTNLYVTTDATALNATNRFYRASSP